MEFVSPDLREEHVPCRFVPLTLDGVTVDSLYRQATLEESEEAVRGWLQRQIQKLETGISEAAKQKAIKLLAA